MERSTGRSVQYQVDGAVFGAYGLGKPPSFAEVLVTVQTAEHEHTWEIEVVTQVVHEDLPVFSIGNFRKKVL